jgi:hypothetical protein
MIASAVARDAELDLQPLRIEELGSRSLKRLRCFVGRDAG